MRRSLIVLGITLLVCYRASAQEVLPAVGIFHRDGMANNQYCGIYCLYHAGKIYGITPDLGRLLRPEFLTGKHGSSVADLIRAAAEFQLSTTFLPEANYLDLCLLDGPILVPVKTSPQSHEASHWILILRADPTGVTVYDPALGQLQVPAAELKQIWSGPALIVHSNAQEATRTHAGWVIGRVVAVAAVIGLTVFLLVMMSRTRTPSLVGLMSTALLMALLGHALDPSGFLHNKKTLSQMAFARTTREVPVVGVEAVIIPDRSTRIIDVRTAAQYQSSRIPKAIHLPLDGSFWKNERRLADIPRTHRLILYCNSEQCVWSGIMAKSALFMDFTDVIVFEAGMAGFEAAGGQFESGKPLEAPR
jgi:rhodanese-related sulfurtransferase/predicted double-glycine peptidase